MCVAKGRRGEHLNPDRRRHRRAVHLDDKKRHSEFSCSLFGSKTGAGHFPRSDGFSVCSSPRWKFLSEDSTAESSHQREAQAERIGQQASFQHEFRDPRPGRRTDQIQLWGVGAGSCELRSRVQNSRHQGASAAQPVVNSTPGLGKSQSTQPGDRHDRCKGCDT